MAEVYEVTVTDNGNTIWTQHGKYHRIGGPAIEYSDGRNDWYIHGNLHRVDGPAIVHADGTEEWWIDGVKLTWQQFARAIHQPVKEMTIAEIEAELGYQIKVVK